MLNRLVDSGNTVIAIEHDLSVIAQADQVIDLGPEGGDGGGLLVCTGSPMEVADHPGSHTGKWLAKFIEKARASNRAAAAAPPVAVEPNHTTLSLN